MSLVHDVRIVLRTLGRRPGMVSAIILTLALGIGANTAVYSLVDAVLLHPVPGIDSKQFVSVYGSGQETPFAASSFAFYQAIAERAQSITAVSAYTTSQLELREGDQTDDVSAALVTEKYFGLLGVAPALGRAIAPSDVSGPQVAVLSNALWRRHFGGDSAIVGKRIALRGQQVIVVGVMPGDFRGADLTNVPDLWLPLSLAPALNLPLLISNGQMNPRMPFFSIVGRLRPGTTSAQAESELAILASQAEAAMPSIEFGRTAAPRISVIPLNESVAVRDRSSLLTFLRLLAGVAILTLILACLNIANLLIVRSRERARELGVRLALGAGARHIVQQTLSESLLLALVGGIAGIAVAFFALHMLSAFMLPGRISLDRVQPAINARVLVFSCGLSLLTALAFGLLPALRATRTSVIDVVRNQRQSGSLGRGHVGLIALQIAISLVLLVDAGLLVRTIRSGLSTGIGFDAQKIAALSLAPKFEGRYSETVADCDAIIAALRTKPGISAAAVGTHVPLKRFGKSPFSVGPVPPVGTSEHPVMTGVSYVSDGYFDVLGVPVVRGRAFGSQDIPGDVGSVIINESAAAALFPNESPIGKLVHAPWFNNAMPRPHVVVGVVRDTKYGALEDAQVPFAYFRMAQLEPPGAAFTVLARSNQPRAALRVMDQTVGEVAHFLKIARTSTASVPVRRVVSDQVLSLLKPQRFGASLLLAFAFVALCVSAVGIYGTVAYAVSQRTTEIGIRMALGARARNVLSIVLIDTGVAVAIGTVAGLVGASVTSTLLRRLLFGVEPFDLIAFAAALGTLATTACAAAMIPSWRSVSIDPARAIRTST